MLSVPASGSLTGLAFTRACSQGHRVQLDAGSREVVSVSSQALMQLEFDGQCPFEHPNPEFLGPQYLLS